MDYANSPLLHFTNVTTPPATGSPLAAACDAFSARLIAANIPVDYLSAPMIDATVQVTAKVNGHVRSNAAGLAEWLPKYERSFGESTAPKSLYLFSRGKGVGKTATACRLLIDYMATQFVAALKEGRTPPQRIGYFLDLTEMQTSYNIASMTHDDEGMARIGEVVKRVQHAEMTVLDDVGVRSATEAFRAYVHAIVNYRVANGKPTIYTSNIEVDELANVFDERLADRVREKCFEITWMENDSKRGIRS
jgi:DNA replication protein DnaC